MKTKILTTALALIISCSVAISQNKTKPTEKQAPQKETKVAKESVYYTCSMHRDVKLDKPGKCPTCGMALKKKTMEMTGTKKETMEMTGTKKETMEATKTYTCSMHPEVKSDKPGKCPKCGMDLIVKK